MLKSLKNQSAEYELILMNNTRNKFKSASKALNYGASKAKNKYLMFIHQDMALYSYKWIENIESTLNSLKNVGIAGIAGKSSYKDEIITNIEDNIPPKQISPEQIKNPVKVQTLDECLFIIPKDRFNIIQFDEEICDDWHLYGVDYSLSIKEQGYNAYVIPMYAYHRSSGFSLSENYFFTLKKVLKKHKDNYKIIFTTIGDWATFYPLNIQRKLPGSLNKKIMDFMKHFK